MEQNAKQTLLAIMSGSDFYFRFTRINLYRNSSMILQLTSDNCDYSYTTFRKGGLLGGMVTKLDFEDDAMSRLQKNGIFQGLDSGFDLWLDRNGWYQNSNEGNIFSIIYPIGGGGIDALVLVAEGNTVRLQIVSNNYTILLCDPLTYSAS